MKTNIVFIERFTSPKTGVKYVNLHIIQSDGKTDRVLLTEEQFRDFGFTEDDLTSTVDITGPQVDLGFNRRGRLEDMELVK